MRSLLGVFFIVLLSLSTAPAIGACGSAHDFPDLTGEKWKGRWEGTMSNRVELTVSDQSAAKVSGTITMIHRGRHKFSVSGEMSIVNSAVQLTLRGPTAVFVFTEVSENTLKGTGEGRQHSGPIELSRD